MTSNSAPDHITRRSTINAEQNIPAEGIHLCTIDEYASIILVYSPDCSQGRFKARAYRAQGCVSFSTRSR
ncbi:hypothetical protein TNCV_3233841 [Trichonephila clavipes]|nr:hypothetical protein TNCV_3233841 [Trichonephila clavipes]